MLIPQVLRRQDLSQRRVQLDELVPLGVRRELLFGHHGGDLGERLVHLDHPLLEALEPQVLRIRNSHA